jgi:hypothetical protein
MSPNWSRRVAGALVFLAIVGGANLIGVNQIATLFGALDVDQTSLVLDALSITIFALAGYVSGIVAPRRDPITLVLDELVASALVGLSVLMSLAEAGTAVAARNSVVGLIGLFLLGLFYLAAPQRQKGA